MAGAAREALTAVLHRSLRQGHGPTNGPASETGHGAVSRRRTPRVPGSEPLRDARGAAGVHDALCPMAAGSRLRTMAAASGCSQETDCDSEVSTVTRARAR